MKALAPTCVAVFDSNVLVRIALARTPAVNRLWEAAREGKFRLLTSPSILAELDRVLHYARIARKYALTDEKIARFLNVLRQVALLTEDLYEVSRVEVDATDNIFLACALEGCADYLVSEDPHLRDIHDYHGVRIIGLHEFQKIIGL